MYIKWNYSIQIHGPFSFYKKYNDLNCLKIVNLIEHLLSIENFVGKCMNRKIADSKKRWYTTFFTLKEGFKIVQEKICCTEFIL